MIVNNTRRAMPFPMERKKKKKEERKRERMKREREHDAVGARFLLNSRHTHA
jgi:hypothetical protein